MNLITMLKTVGIVSVSMFSIIACGSNSETGSAAPQTASATGKEGGHEHSGAAMSGMEESSDHDMHEHHMSMNESQDGTIKNGFDTMPAPGTSAHCPVMNSDFEVTADSQHSEYKGKTYVFCCPGCKGKFDADPEKFVTQ